ncbi:hypothetical protein CONPUDRAFT_135225 [Coniophora puteana RWD-64-598 SS2]|uniref:F-box domain-containing protein n=1 Tax=Coniophora puteana (strain RWD-64-598) TaxID=741705 RepID=A0A5M3N2K1_CONPW|nr:uncharacterized protein CONPUDRAFT_135225 [Coniophora puteana RWD-64-598 SS2]EIW85507.1 hypothetical protein CONPUDRAFT_135225 [Coniophora puteana RWD-64-598 SS2]
MKDIRPLLNCLPEGLILQQRHRVFDQIIECSLLRPFTPSDWAIFRRYSSRILELGTVPSDNVSDRDFRKEFGFSEELLRALTRPLAPEPLFPRLRSLKWCNFWTKGFDFVKVILGPSITSLVIRPPSSEKHNVDILAMLSTACPCIKTFEWKHSNHSEPSMEEVDVVSRLVCSWHELEEVICWALNSTAIQHLASLPSLRKLSFRPHGISFPVLSSPTFPFVKVLDIASPYHQSLSVVAAFIGQCRSSPTSLIARGDKATTISMQELLTALLEQLDKSRLSDLHIQETDSETEIPLKLSSFKLAFQFCSLSTVRIDSGRAVELDDEALLEMADAWPNIITLEINDRRGWKPQSDVSLYGLRAMLQRLPVLQKLSIAVDTVLLRRSRIIEDDRYGQFRVTRPFDIHVEDSWVYEDDVAEVAAFFSDLFPEMNDPGSFSYFAFAKDILDEIEPADEVRAVRARWNIVVQTILTMNRIRRRELGLIAGVSIDPCCINGTGALHATRA